MYCPKCGSENPDDAKVCRSCSAVLSKAPATIEDRFPKTSGLAIAAFVLGLLSLVFFPTGIVAIILGIISIVMIEKSGGRLTGRIFAIIGIVLPVIVFCMVLVLLLPAISRVNKQARAVACMANLKQWSLFYVMYTEDNDGRFFDGGADKMGCWWMNPLQPYCRNDKQLLLCTEAMTPYTGGDRNAFGAWKIGDDLGSYGLNGWICNPDKDKTELRGRGPGENYWRTPNVQRANNIPLFLDAMWFDAWPRQDDDPPQDEYWLSGQVSETEMKANENEMRRFCVNRHQGYVNGLFMDFSVRKVGLKELWKLKWHRTYNTDGPWTMAGSVQPSDWPEWMRQFRDY